MSDAHSQTGHLPSSDALAEASPVSLTDLFSRNPESYNSQDLAVIIRELREQRARFAKAETEGKRPPAPRKATVSLKNKVGDAAAEPAAPLSTDLLDL